MFNGKAKQSPAEWLRQFQNYIAFRNVSDEQAAKLFKVLMVKQAADWLDSRVVHICMRKNKFHPGDQGTL